MQSKYNEALETKQERVESYNWFDLRDQEFMECRLRLIECIQCLDKIQSHLSKASSVNSGKSRCSESVASSHSAHSMRLEAAAKSERASVISIASSFQISIADPKEKAFKQLIHKDQI